MRSMVVVVNVPHLDVGTAGAVDEAHQITLNEAYITSTARFSRRPSPSEMPTVFFINELATEAQIN